MAVVFGQDNALTPANIVNAPWWFDPTGDFTIAWGNATTGTFTYAAGNWTLSGALPPTVDGVGLLDQGDHTAPVDWFDATLEA